MENHSEKSETDVSDIVTPIAAQTTATRMEENTLGAEQSTSDDASDGSTHNLRTSSKKNLAMKESKSTTLSVQEIFSELEHVISNKILILDAGGTICCAIEEKSGKLVPTNGVIKAHIECDPQFASIKGLIDVKKATSKTIDSSQITTRDWLSIVNAVEVGVKEGYRGIVITHGTDTLAYTAAMLTFMFSFLPIPIVLTAAQFPLKDPYTDAKNNLYGACIAAFGEDPAVPASSDKPIWYFPEVMVFINHRLLLGSRIRKTDANQVDAFEASIDQLGTWTNHRIYLNVDAARRIVRSRVLKLITKRCQLDKIEAEDQLHKHLLKKKCLQRYHSAMLERDKEFIELRRIILANHQLIERQKGDHTDQHKVALLKLCPTMQKLETVMIEHLYREEGYRFFVIEAYGTGNGPEGIINWFGRNADCFAAIVSQCHKGFVSEIYGASFQNTDNVVLCGDTTTECAVAKMWACVGGKETLSKMQNSLRGEMTGPSKYY